MLSYRLLRGSRLGGCRSVGLHAADLGAAEPAMVRPEPATRRGAAAGRATSAPTAQPGEAPGAGLVPEGAVPGAEGQSPQVQVQLPPPPEVPPLPKGPTPPAAIVGVLSVRRRDAGLHRLSAGRQGVRRAASKAERGRPEGAGDAARSRPGLGQRAQPSSRRSRSARARRTCRTGSPSHGACSASATASSRRPAST